MLILTEKPSVAQDFATALGCTKSGIIFRSSDTVITNCVGHLFSLEEPKHYGQSFPIIPEIFDYRINPKVQKQAELVIKLLKTHKNDNILIATDADREGEIIARECLSEAGIRDYSRIKRFWVSEALTPEVVKNGIRNAKPLTEYDRIAEQGFARQRADWLTGMNFCRYITQAARTKLAVGRVQTAILSAIAQRCDKIKNFRSERYYEHYGIFQNIGIPSLCKGIYFENENTSFADDNKKNALKKLLGKKAVLEDKKIEKKNQNPPQLYNINALQKDAFKHFEYTAEKTLSIVQKLYEELKCVSYPRTPSRVMGSGNVELCEKIARELSVPYKDEMDFSNGNKRCFNDKKLEAHHALIPLKALPDSATDEERYIYSLILDRFCVAFLPPCVYEKQTYIISIEKNRFRITGKKILEKGWKKNSGQKSLEDDEEQEEELQLLDNFDWNNLLLKDVETKEKWTKPPAYYNEASILSFAENPKNLDEEKNEKKLVGLGTPATRHTFIPKLKKYGYIIDKSKKFSVTPLGETLLKAVRSSPIKSLADISETTGWEERLDEDPGKFLSDIKTFVKESVSKDIKIDIPQDILSQHCDKICPVCGKEVKKGKSNWYCTGYKEGCKFVIWETIAGSKLTDKDVSLLCSGKKTGIKHCKSKVGKDFECRFQLGDDKSIKFVFEEKKNGKSTKR